jgi:hypothetical protein
VFGDGWRSLKESIGLEVEAFELRGPNRSRNVSPHGSSIHLMFPLTKDSERLSGESR